MIYVGYCPPAFCREAIVFVADNVDAIPPDVLNYTRFHDDDRELAFGAARKLAQAEGVEISYPNGL